MKIKYYHISI